MKLNQKKSLTQVQTFDSPHQQAMLTRPNPPTQEAVEKAQFIDKTYYWQGSAANKAVKP
jgi:hypothetical protein